MRVGVGRQRRKYGVAFSAYLWRLRLLIIIHKCGKIKIEFSDNSVSFKKWKVKITKK